MQKPRKEESTMWRKVLGLMLGLLVLGATAGITMAEPDHTSNQVAKGSGSIGGQIADAELSVTLAWYNGVWDPRLEMWRYDDIITAAGDTRYQNGDLAYGVYIQELEIDRKNNYTHFLYNPSDPKFTSAYPEPTGQHNDYQDALKLFELTLEMIDERMAFILNAAELVDALISTPDAGNNNGNAYYEWIWDDGPPWAPFESDASHYVRFLVFVEPEHTGEYTINDYMFGPGYEYIGVAWHMYAQGPPAPDKMSSLEKKMYRVEEITPEELKLKANQLSIPKDIIETALKERKPVYITHMPVLIIKESVAPPKDLKMILKKIAKIEQIKEKTR